MRNVKACPSGRNQMITDGNQDLPKKMMRDFPGGPVVKSPPSNAGDAGSIPGWGTKIPHATGQLGPHATTTEPTCHN